MPDSEILAALKRGKTDVIADVIYRYQDALFRYAMRMLNFHRQDSEDVVSESFIKMYQNRLNFGDDTNLKNWLYRVVHNLCIDKYRQDSKLKIIDIDNLNLEIKSDADMHKKEFMMIAEKVLNQLEIEDRSLIILSVLEDRNKAEIAKILDIKIDQIYLKIFRAKRKAIKLIEKYHV